VVNVVSALIVYSKARKNKVKAKIQRKLKVNCAVAGIMDISRIFFFFFLWLKLLFLFLFLLLLLLKSTSLLILCIVMVLISSSFVAFYCWLLYNFRLSSDMLIKSNTFSTASSGLSRVYSTWFYLKSTLDTFQLKGNFNIKCSECIVNRVSKQ